MSDTPGFIATQVKKAEEKLLGTKFCFACQKQRPVETGKAFVRGKNRVWKCFACINKLTPPGISKKGKEAYAQKIQLEKLTKA
jgi:ribosomal protein L37AE/L43A